MHPRHLGKFSAQCRQLSNLRLFGRVIAEFPIVHLIHARGLAISSIFLGSRKQFDPIFEGPLGAILIDGALGGEAVQVEHGLYIEQLHRSFKHAPIISNRDLIERQVVLEGALRVSDDHSAAVSRKTSYYEIFGKVDRQLYELLMHFLHCLRTVLCERVLERKWNVLVKGVD